MNRTISISALKSPVARAGWLVAFCVACSAPSASRATAQRPCKVVHVGSYPLRLDSSTFILLAPREAARSPSGLTFFAGSPRNYVLPNRPAVEKHVIGVIADTVGNSRLVTVPMLADSVESVHVSALPDSNWAAAFIEVTGAPNRSFPKTKRLWHGIHDGTRWTRLDSIPVPPGVAIDFTSSSSLVYRDKMLTWAAGTDEPEGVLVFSRDVAAGEWQVTRLTGNASYLDLAYQQNGELLVAMVGPDRTFSRADGNSLYVRRVYRPDVATRRAANSEESAVHYPAFVNTPDGALLVWTAAPQGDLRQGSLRAAYIAEQGIGPAINIADSVVVQPPLVIPPGNAFPLVWVTEHEQGQTEARRLRFWQRVDGHITEIGNFSDNYLMTITEMAWPGRVLLLGAERYSPFGGIPVSVLRSFQIVCSRTFDP